MNRCQFVEDHQRRYGVKRLCRILGIARSSFYYWRRAAPGRAVRQAADVELAARIRTIHRASDGTYGVPRITAELHEDGERVNHKRVARVMRTIGLAGLRLRRKHRTTIPDPAAAKVPDLIGRNFTADEVNTKRAFADACRRAGVTQSMSAVGSSADNALAESFNATCKRETLQGRRAWNDEREARLDLFRWLHRYNTVRRHSRLGHRSPIAYERTLRTTSTTLAEAA